MVVHVVMPGGDGSRCGPFDGRYLDGNDRRPRVATTAESPPGHGTTRARGSTTASSSLLPCWASSNWSGYAVSETSPSGLSCVPASGTAYTSVTGTWTVPTVTGSRDLDLLRRLDRHRRLHQFPPHPGRDGTGLTGGSAHYLAWWEILPAAETPISSITVEPGDSITVSITQVSVTAVVDHADQTARQAIGPSPRLAPRRATQVPGPRRSGSWRLPR